MSYQLKVIKDYPVGFWPLDESSGTIAADISGCGNNGTYIGTHSVNLLPIVPGGVSGTKITNVSYIEIPTSNDYYSKDADGGLATKNTSDNDFTIEVWVSPSITSLDETVLFADATNNIGLFWDNGDIVFKISSDEQVRYALTYTKKATHIVGNYTGTSISLYLDGVQVKSKPLSDFKFTNSILNLTIGPTESESDYFIVDAPAVYRYSLSQTLIKQHYIDGSLSTYPIHVVYPDKGTLFSCTDANIRGRFDYSYPVDKSLASFIDENTYYDLSGQYISFYQTESAESKTFIINDSFSFPAEAGFITSKIEWRNNYGIAVESSIDGINYTECINGQPLPQYNLDNFDESPLVYIRITMSTTDATKYLPRLEFFCVTFYTAKYFNADNYGDEISSSSEYYLGSKNYPIMLRHNNNGIRPKNGTGFDLNTDQSIKSVELFLTPYSSAANTLLYSGDGTVTRMAWNGSGALSKANIASIYINGQDRSSITNIASYLTSNEPTHIVLEFTQAISGKIQFNYELSGGASNLYKNIAIYESILGPTKALEHYNLYIGKSLASIAEPAISLTEPGVEYYNNDWIVISSR